MQIALTDIVSFFCTCLKWQCQEIFLATFFSLIEPTQAHNTQAKMVLLTNSISRRYSNFLVSQPIKNLTKNVGLCRNSSLLFLNKFRILFQGKERLAKTKLMPAKQCQPAQCICRLRTVLVTFGFAKISFADSIQWQSILDFKKILNSLEIEVFDFAV